MAERKGFEPLKNSSSALGAQGFLISVRKFVRKFDTILALFVPLFGVEIGQFIVVFGHVIL